MTALIVAFGVGLVTGVVGTIVVGVILLAREFTADRPGNGKLK